MPVPDGMDRHHWSYNEEHRKDIIPLTTKDHAKIHRYMTFDKSVLMYRQLDGKLLNTKAKARRYYDYVLTLDDGEYPANPPN